MEIVLEFIVFDSDALFSCLSRIKYTLCMLYKYLPADSSIKVLESLRLRFTRPSRLNDPFELKPKYIPIGETSYFQENLATQDVSQIGEELLEQGLSQFPPEFVESMPRELLSAIFQPNELTIKAQATLMMNELTSPLSSIVYSKLDEMIGVLCLSETPANTLMWSHYANAHFGVVLGFDESHIYFNSPLVPGDSFRRIKKVDYTPTRNEIDVLEFDNDPSFLFEKTKDWEYEREWRMFFPLEYAAEVIQLENDALHLFSFPADALREVVFGLRTDSTDKDKILDILKRPSLAHVTVRVLQEKDFD